MSCEILSQAVRGKLPGRRDASGVLEGVARGTVPREALASLLTALTIFGETPEVLLGFIDILRENMVRLPASVSGAIDVCGTGGDGQSTVNISTAAAFVVAACGVPVAKHGNHGVSSKSGSADVLDALGVDIRQGAKAAAECLRRVGIGFLYAPLYHPLFASVAPVRRALGFRTAFNILGPLCNPAGVKRQLIGVSSRETLDLISRVLAALDTERALVVYTPGPYDEVALTDVTAAVLVERGGRRELKIAPSDFGMRPVPAAVLAGGRPGENAERILEVLRGGDENLAAVICANAGCALFAAGTVASPAEGFKAAHRAVSSGRALAKLESMRDFSDGRKDDVAGGSL